MNVRSGPKPRFHQARAHWYCCLFPLLILGAAEPTALGDQERPVSREYPVGFLGDRTGRFPAARPPTVWDCATGSNVVWRSDLPSWGRSSVIAVGKRLFTTADPATLICVDADSGKIIWSRDNHPFALFPADAGEEALRQEWPAIEANWWAMLTTDRKSVV